MLAVGLTLLTTTARAAAPANDNFSSAQVISGTSGSVTGTNTGATAETGEPGQYPYDGSGMGNTIWYRWIAGSSGTYDFSSIKSAIPSQLSVYTGSSLTALTLVARGLSWNGTNRGRVHFTATAGTTYQIQLDTQSFGQVGTIELDWSPYTPPTNDAFANAQALAGDSGSVAGDAWGATAEPGEPAHGGDVPVATVWYRFHARATGLVHFNLRSNSFNCSLAAYTGTSVSSLTEVASVGRNYQSCDSIEVDAVAGTDYSIVVNDTTPDYATTFTLLYGYYPPPNDDLYPTSPPPWLTNGEPIAAHNIGGTKQSGEPNHAGNAGGHSVWYAWASSLPGTVTIDTVGSSFDTLLAVYSGQSVAQLTQVAADDDSGGGGTSKLSFHAEPNVDYWVAIDGKNGASGNFTVHTSFKADPPPNDAFASAIELLGDHGDRTGVNVSATKESGEPAHAGNGGGHSVWYRWVAPSDGWAVFDTADRSGSVIFPETTFDTLLAVYTGGSVDRLTQVVANDDYGDPMTSRVAFNATKGVVYSIAIDGRDGAQGSFKLYWELGPPNDDFANAAVLTGRSGEEGGTTRGATFEWNDGFPGDPGLGSVWYRWTAPATETVSFRATASYLEPYDVSVYSTPDFDKLDTSEVRAKIVADPYTRTVTVTFNAVGGTVYRLRVESDYYNVFSLKWGPDAWNRPPNDDVANAQLLTGESGSVTGTNVDATLEPGEPALDPDRSSYKTVWYRWTAPYTGTAVFDFTGSSFTTVVGVFGGTTVDTLRRFVIAAARPRFGVTAGVTYTIGIGGDVDQSGTVALTWSRAGDAPANDPFSAAQTLSGSSGSVTANTTGASTELGEPHVPFFQQAPSVWFRWTAPASGYVSFDTSGTTNDTALGAYTGSSVGALTSVAENNDATASAKTSRIAFNAVAGTTYSIAVSSTPAGTATLTWRQPPAPPNDAFSNASDLPLQSYSIYKVHVEGDTNVGATKEAGEPSHAGNAGGHSVWYRWTPNANQTFVLHTIGSDFDTLLAVYTGSSVSALTKVAGDDDSGGGGASRLTFAAASGVTYYIAVDGKNGATGRIDLTGNISDAPLNDNFDAAQTLVGPSGTVNGSFLNATWQDGEPQVGFSGISGSIWYRWTAPASGTWRFDITGSDGAAQGLGVYVGNDYKHLVELAQSDEYFVRVPVVAGATYYVLTGGFQSTTTTGKLVLTWGPSGAQANDVFASAQVLTGTRGTVTGTTAQGSVELGEPYHADILGGSSFWFSWTAPASGTATVDTRGSAFDTVLAVYTGSSVSALTPVAANDNDGGSTSLVRFQAVSGTTYRIAVDGFETWNPWHVPTGPYTLSWSVDAPPANDLLASAQVLTGDAGTVTGTNVGARKEPGEPWHSENAGGASVWYRWTPSTSGTVTLDSGASGFDSLLGVYTGSSVGALSVVRRSDATDPRASRYVFAAVAGTTYQIAVDGYAGATGSVSLTWRTGGPLNDAFAAAQQLVGRSGTVVGSNARATKEAGEPAHAGNAGGASVWYTWTASQTESITFDTIGSTFDTLLAVYRGSSVGSLTALAANDDARGVTSSELRVLVTKGYTYLIAVDGKNGATGNVVLNWRPTPKPPNDDFGDAQPIDGRSGGIAGTTLEATKEAGEPNHGGVVGGHSVWYAWKAPAAGTAIFDFYDKQFTPVLAVYSGGSLAGLTQVAAGAPARWSAAAGTTYWIAVDVASGIPGEFQLTWRLQPPNDMFAAAATISGSSGSVAGTTDGASAEPAEPATTSWGARTSVWYRWTAPAAGTYRFSVTGDDGGKCVSVFSGSTLSGLVSAGTSDNLQRTVRVGVAAGAVLSVAVDTCSYPAGSFTLEWAAVSDAPANDNLAAAQALSSAQGTLTATTFLASREAGEPWHAHVGSGTSVWYRWTAPSSGRVDLDTRGSVVPTALAVYTGSSPGALTEVTSNSGYWGDNGSFVYFLATAGVTYQIAVDGASGASGAFTLHWRTPGSAPANDAFASAVALTGTTGTATGSNSGATLEAGEPQHAGSPGVGASVWFTWTAASSGTLRLDTIGSDFDTVLGVYTGTSVGALTQVAANDNSGRANDGTASLVRFSVTKGVTYRIAVAGASAQIGAYQLNWSLALDVTPPTVSVTAPAAGARISGTAVTLSAAASDDTGVVKVDFLVNGVVVGSDTTAPYSVSWDSTRAADGGARFSAHAWDAADNVGNANDVVATIDNQPPETLITAGPADAAYTTTASFSFISDDSPVSFACSLDGASYAACTSPTVYSDLAAGTHTFSVRATDAGGKTDPTPATRTWTVQPAGAPPNDLFAAARPLSGASGSLTQSTASATAEANEPAHAGRRAAASVWFSWTAPSAGPATFDTLGSSFDTVLAVYTGNDVATLTPVASDDDSAGGGLSRVRFDAVAGTTYRIAVDGYGGATGSLVLEWQLASPPPRPANDDFAAAQLLSGGSGSVTGSNVGATRETNEPYHVDKLGGHSVWYGISGVGNVTVDTVGSSFDTLLAVYTGTSVGALTKVAASDDADGAQTSRVSFTAVAGTTYWIAVDGFLGATGNVTLHWNVASSDTTPPETSIGSGPAAYGNQSSVSFVFASSEPGSRFECALDGAAWAACSSPQAYSGLADGAHSFQVRAIDPAGNSDPTPASRSFTIDTSGGLLVNGSFEGSASGWATWNSQTSITTDGIVGSHALRLTLTTSDRYALISSPKPVDSAQAAPYQLTGWLRSDNPGKSVCLRLREWQAGTVVKSPQNCLTATSSWQRFPTVTLTPTAGDQLDINIIQYGATPGDNFETDGLSLTQQ